MEAALLGRWLPWAIALEATAALVVWRGLGRPRLGRLAWLAALPLVTAAHAAALAVLVPTVESERPPFAIAYLATLVIATLLVLALLWRDVAQLTDRRAAWLIGVAVLAFSLGVLPYVRTVQPTASDEPHYLIITQSLVLDHDLDLANDYGGTRYRAFYEDTLRETHGIQVGARVYSIRDLGLPILAVPAFALAGRTGVLALVCLAGALLAVVLFLLVRAFGVRPRPALVTVGAAALLHPLSTYTTQVSPELFAALLFALAAYALRRGAASTPRSLAIASAAAGLIGIFTTRGWLLSAGVGLCVAYWSLRPFGTRRLAAGALPFLALVLASSLGNCLMFPTADGRGCSFMPSAGYFLLKDQQQVLTFAPQVGLTGLLFDRTFGLLSHVPLYLLSFAGIPRLVARWRAGSAAAAPLVLGWLLLSASIASIAYWWADGAPPSRYLVAGMPLWVVTLGLGFEALAAYPRRVGAAARCALGTWSAAVTAVFLYNPALRSDLAADIARTGSPGQLWLQVRTWFHVNLGLLFPSLVNVRADSVVESALWWLVCAAVLAAGYLPVARDHVDPRLSG